MPHQRHSGAFRTDDARQHQDAIENLFDGALVRDQDVDAGLDEVVRDLRLQVGKADHQVGSKFEDFVDLRRSECRDFGFQPRLFRAAREAGNTDDAFVLAEKVERLGGLTREANDALRTVCRFHSILT